MRRRILFPGVVATTFSLLAMAAVAEAETVVPGGNLASQTWIAAHSPYRITGDVTVLAGATLRIEAGTMVLVDGPDSTSGGIDPTQVELTVRGALQIAGTAESPVHIGAVPTSTTSWRGIVVTAQATEATISHAVIEDAWRGIDSRALGNALVVRDSVFHQNGNAGMFLHAGSPVLERVDFVDNGTYGIRTENVGPIAWDRITAVDNGLGISIYQGSGELSNVLVTNNSSKGITLEPSQDATLTLRHATVRGNHDGISANVLGASSVVVVNSIIAGSTRGVLRFSLNDSGTLKVLNSVVFQNTTDFNDDEIVVTGTFVADPRFVSASDSHLLPDSPCIDSALAANAPAHDLDGRARGTTPDIGAYELVPSVCGDSVLDGFEQCDDGNLLDDDGCSSECAIELVPLPVDAGVPDTGVADAGIPDAGEADAGEADAGEADAAPGPVDAGSDATPDVVPDATPGTHADATPSPEPPVTDPEDGCSCRVGGPSRGAPPAGAMVLGALVVLAMIRRRRPR